MRIGENVRSNRPTLPETPIHNPRDHRLAVTKRGKERDCIILRVVSFSFARPKGKYNSVDSCRLLNTYRQLNRQLIQ
jgi:hypothetical protein